MRRLVTIPFSHFCEKARWALDHHAVAFVEEGHAPVFHIRAIRRAGGTRTSPALIEDDGRVIDDSTLILEHLDRRARSAIEAGEPYGGRGPLYPDRGAAEVRELEELFDTRLGPATRRIGYHHMLQYPSMVKKMMLIGVPAGERLAVRTINPLIRAAIRRALQIDTDGVERSTGRLSDVFERVEAMLGDGRGFLVGDRFSAADLTFAALASPLLFPPQSRAPMPPLSEVPQPIRETVEHWRGRTAGQFALRLFAEQRPQASAAA